MRQITRVLSTVCLFTLAATALEAHTKTLPKGVWQAQYRTESFEFIRIGAEEMSGFDAGTLKGIPNGNPKFVSAEEFKVKHIPNLTGFVLNPDIQLDPEIQLANSFRKSGHIVDIGYGITDKLTVNINLPFRNDALEYTDTYVAVMSQLNGLSSGLDALIVVPPKKAKGTGLGDITLGAKYRITNRLALGGAFRGSFLKVGDDAKERDYSDGVETLKTGEAADYTTLALFYDIPIKSSYVGFMLSHEISGKGYELALDNDFAVDSGDTTYMSIETEIPLPHKFFLGLSLLNIHAAADQKQNDDKSWTKIRNSETTTSMGIISFRHTPKIFVELFTSYQIILHSDVSGGVYDYPGRLLPSDIFNFGMTLYLK